MPDSIEHLVARAVADPAAARDLLDELGAERSLRSFIRLLWPVLEPGRKFIDGWVIGAICEHLEAISKGQITRLLINVPPGCMKSLSLAFWPAWEWGPQNRPDLRYVCASYSEALTIRDNRKCRALIQSERYQRAWGNRFQISAEQDAKVRFDTNRTGFKLATSVQGLGTGERGDRFMIDDPHNVREGESELKRATALQWFTEVVPTRLNDAKKSAIIIIMQRVHERDISGLILSKDLGYDHLCLPMEYEPGHPNLSKTTLAFKDPRQVPGELLWPERFPEDQLTKDKKVLSSWGGTYAVAGQFQQRPTPRGGGMFQRKDFKLVDSSPGPEASRCRGWDLAATKDGHGAFTVGVLMARTLEGRIVVEDVIRLRGSPGEVRRAIAGAAMTDGLNVEQSLPQDPGQAGKAQVDDFATLLMGYIVHFSPESGSKEDRARPLAAQCEAGKVDLVRAAWNDDYVNELASFPMGEFKDQVDASSRAFTRLAGRRIEDASSMPPEIY